VTVRNNDPDNIGSFQTGVSLIADDIGLGGTDGFGLALFLRARDPVNVTFKSPELRNVEFTGPYFHKWRAGNSGTNGIGRITVNAGDQIALVAFLKASSDDRVRYEQAPFDYPSLCVANGADENASGVLTSDMSDPRFTTSAVEKFVSISVVGQGGNKVPLQTFAELLAGIGRDGSRAHTLTDSCIP